MFIIINGLEIDPTKDGDTHINAYSGSACPLGRMLSNFPCMETDTPDGRFLSLEGYYHYLKLSISLDKYDGDDKALLSNKLDSLRYIYGVTAQRTGRDIRSEFIKAGVRVIDKPGDDFTARFKKALHSKITSHPELYEALMENMLPVVHYYVVHCKAYHHKRFDWLSNLITEVEYELKGLTNAQRTE